MPCNESFYYSRGGGNKYWRDSSLSIIVPFGSPKYPYTAVFSHLKHAHPFPRGDRPEVLISFFLELEAQDLWVIPCFRISPPWSSTLHQREVICYPSPSTPRTQWWYLNRKPQSELSHVKRETCCSHSWVAVDKSG